MLTQLEPNDTISASLARLGTYHCRQTVLRTAGPELLSATPLPTFSGLLPLCSSMQGCRPSRDTSYATLPPEQSQVPGRRRLTACPKLLETYMSPSLSASLSISSQNIRCPQGWDDRSAGDQYMETR